MSLVQCTCHTVSLWQLLIRNVWPFMFSFSSVLTAPSFFVDRVNYDSLSLNKFERPEQTKISLFSGIFYHHQFVISEDNDCDKSSLDEISCVYNKIAL